MGESSGYARVTSRLFLRAMDNLVGFDQSSITHSSMMIEATSTRQGRNITEHQMHNLKDYIG